LSYSNNPYLPKARMIARNDVVVRKLPISQVARKYGVHRSTVWRWVKKVKRLGLNGNTYLWTQSSAPHHHPNETKPEVVKQIIKLRKKLNRCAPIIHAHLKNKGVRVGLSTVSKILKKYKLIRKKKQLKDYKSFPRPKIEGLGSLVEVDTMHFVRNDYSRHYIYVVIDVFSRLGYLEYKNHISGKQSIKVILNAQKHFGFEFKVVQTDHGGEFPPTMKNHLNKIGIKLRYSRVRRPNDNAHVERF